MTIIYCVCGDCIAIVFTDTKQKGFILRFVINDANNTTDKMHTFCLA